MDCSIQSVLFFLFEHFLVQPTGFLKVALRYGLHSFVIWFASVLRGGPFFLFLYRGEVAQGGVDKRVVELGEVFFALPVFAFFLFPA